MNTEVITVLFNQLLKELATHNYEQGHGIEIADFRDDVIILSKKWGVFRFGGQDG